jgi:hypothetical protein
MKDKIYSDIIFLILLIPVALVIFGLLCWLAFNDDGIRDAQLDHFDRSVYPS